MIVQNFCTGWGAVGYQTARSPRLLVFLGIAPDRQALQIIQGLANGPNRQGHPQPCAAGFGVVAAGNLSPMGDRNLPGDRQPQAAAGAGKLGRNHGIGFAGAGSVAAIEPLENVR